MFSNSWVITLFALLGTIIYFVTMVFVGRYTKPAIKIIKEKFSI